MDPPPEVESEPLSFTKFTTKSYTKNSSTKQDSAALQNGAAKDTLGFSIGPMPTRKFLDTFLPKNYTRNYRIRKNLFEDVEPINGREDAMYNAFVSHHATTTFWI